MSNNIKDPFSSGKSFKGYIRGFRGRLLKILRGNSTSSGIAAVVLFVSILNYSGANTSFIFDNRIAEMSSSDGVAEGWSLANIAFVYSEASANQALVENSSGEDVEDSSNLSLVNPLMMSETALISYSSPVDNITPYIPRKEIIIYTVKQGDVLSTIAGNFGISTNTLLWANNLNAYSLIRPGDKLKILPASGVMHEVARGDSIGVIAKKYKVEESAIISFNDLPADGAIVSGQVLIVPGGEKPSPVATSRTYAVSSGSSSSGSSSGKFTSNNPFDSHNFPYGQCTWYVAQRRYVPWSGHAKSWLYNAKAAGFVTGNLPKIGSIIVTSESWYGHVAYVESINGDWVTISEMNFPWGSRKVNWRTINLDSSIIRGYIY